MSASSASAVQGLAGGVRAYSFGRFCLDLRRSALLRDGAEVRLRPKSFDVLHLLIRRAGRLVSREELLEAVWPNLVVTDDSLTQCLIEIRKALGDEHKSIIRTVPRRGYLFEASVEVHGAAAGAELRNGGDGAGAATRRSPSLWTIAGLVVLGVAIAVTWWRLGIGPAGKDEPTATWQPPPASIAVLPFVDMSEAGDQKYLAHGLAEEILNLLAQSSSLTVIARTSSFSFKDADADIGTIARRLNVAHVLEGSVRTAGDRVRVTAQLVDGATGAHIWSQTYDDRLRDLFALQDKIAQGVAEVLKVHLDGNALAESSGTATGPPPDPRAWERYMRGRLFYSRRAEGDVMRAQRSFEEALEIDPGMADAWVSLAATINLRRGSSKVSEEERLTGEVALPLMRDALEKALSMDPHHPEALWRNSRFARLDGKEEEALSQVQRAIAGSQNHALVQAMMWGFAFQTGHPLLSLPFLSRAVILDPTSATHRGNLALSLQAAGRLEEAENALRQALELNPDLQNEFWRELTWIRIQQGNFQSAAETAEQLPPGPDRDQARAILDHLEGDQQAADEALGRLLARPPEEVADRLAFVYAMRDETDEATRWLATAGDVIVNSNRGCSAGGDLVHLQYSPFLKPLHSDKRWEAWLNETSQQLLSDVDRRMVEILEDHLENHPELYAQVEHGPDP